MKIEDYFTDEEKLKMNIKVKVKYKEEMILKSNDLNETIEIRRKNEIYRLWKVKFIRPHIFKFIKDKCIYSLICNEINNIDIVVFNNKLNNELPIEIQKTSLRMKDGIRFNHSDFEDSIRRQLEINIETYGICWFFMDSEYLRFLQSDNIGKTTSINLTWIPKLMKESTLKVFSIRYDGEVKELTTKDFDFLNQIYTEDEIIMNKNKLKIFHNVTNGYKFTQEEISQFENKFNDDNDDSKSRRAYFQESNNKRCNLYGNITDTINHLSITNNMLSCSNSDRNLNYYGITLGLFHQNDFHGQSEHARIQFVDKFNIAQYFPGYLRNKEMWDYCKSKQRIFTISEFSGIVEGREHCLKLIKQQSKSLANYD